MATGGGAIRRGGGGGNGNGNGNGGGGGGYTCQVCSKETNSHLYYGALVCKSCRAFFRRCVVDETAVKCLRDADSCGLVDTTSKCPSCRLAKCYAVGMKESFIKGPNERLRKFRTFSQTASTGTTAAAAGSTGSSGPSSSSHGGLGDILDRRTLDLVNDSDIYVSFIMSKFSSTSEAAVTTSVIDADERSLIQSVHDAKARQLAQLSVDRRDDATYDVLLGHLGQQREQQQQQRQQEQQPVTYEPVLVDMSRELVAKAETVLFEGLAVSAAARQAMRCNYWEVLRTGLVAHVFFRERTVDLAAQLALSPACNAHLMQAVGAGIAAASAMPPLDERHFGLSLPSEKLFEVGRVVPTTGSLLLFMMAGAFADSTANLGATAASDAEKETLRSYERFVNLFTSQNILDCVREVRSVLLGQY